MQPTGWRLYDLEHEPDEKFIGFLRLLGQVISIRPRSGALSICLAFDMYKIPDDELEPRSWPNTQAGDLVNRSKYRADEEAFMTLTGWMVDSVRTHPSLSEADLVLSVPGKDASVAGHGERLARSVAGGLGKAFLATRPAYETRDPSKEGFTMTPDLVDLRSDEVAGKRLLVVDDVCRSGHSLGAIAEKGLSVGASETFAFVAAKTLRN